MDQEKRLLIARHEAGHAVTALICGKSIKKVSLGESSSPNGTGNYLGCVQLENFERSETITINEAIQRVRIALGGYASEMLFLGDSIKIGCDDLTYAVRRAEDMMQSEDFRKVAASMPIPEPGGLDIIENPIIRAFIEYSLNRCAQDLVPYRQKIELIAQTLLENEKLTGDEVAALLSGK